VYFVGRKIGGEDTVEPLTTRAEMYYNRLLWINDHKDEIIDIVKTRMLK
jgi:hypothetical protein